MKKIIIYYKKNTILHRLTTNEEEELRTKYIENVATMVADSSHCSSYSVSLSEIDRLIPATKIQAVVRGTSIREERVDMEKRMDAATADDNARLDAAEKAMKAKKKK